MHGAAHLHAPYPQIMSIPTDAHVIEKSVYTLPFGPGVPPQSTCGPRREGPPPPLVLPSLLQPLRGLIEPSEYAPLLRELVPTIDAMALRHELRDYLGQLARNLSAWRRQASGARDLVDDAHAP